jgi:hypothetical protein
MKEFPPIYARIKINGVLQEGYKTKEEIIQILKNKEMQNERTNHDQRSKRVS